MWDIISLNRDQTHIPSCARQILNHWTTRKVPDIFHFGSACLQETAILWLSMRLTNQGRYCPWEGEAGAGGGYSRSGRMSSGSIARQMQDLVLQSGTAVIKLLFFFISIFLTPVPCFSTIKKLRRRRKKNIIIPLNPRNQFLLSAGYQPLFNPFSLMVLLKDFSVRVNSLGFNKYPLYTVSKK